MNRPNAPETSALRKKSTAHLREELKSPGRKANCRIYAELVWRRENHLAYRQSR